MRTKASFLTTAACVAAALLACEPLWAATAGQVVIKDFMFTPETLTVKVGTTVTWANKYEEPHTVFSDTGLFRSGAIDTGEVFSFKFDKPGTYHFLCTIHPRMVGTIVVE
jgi:plastocyanin